MGEPLFVSAPMPRTMEQWRNMIPEAVCDGSPAQILYWVRDAQITNVAELCGVSPRTLYNRFGSRMPTAALQRKKRS